MKTNLFKNLCFAVFFLPFFFNCIATAATESIEYSDSIQNDFKQLNLVYPSDPNITKNLTYNPKVFVQWSIKDNYLIANFEVQTTLIHAKETLSTGEYPYQYDVVEVFIAAKSATDDLPFPYFEFEVSPYNESYQVKIIDLKKPFQGGVELGLIHNTEIIKSNDNKTVSGWKAQLKIPLKNIISNFASASNILTNTHWNFNLNDFILVGNAYAILGQSPSRQFFSLYLPLQKKPNFHKPEFFQPLFENNKY